MGSHHSETRLPTVSVIVPVLDEATNIGALFDALDDQTVAPLEVIVVDGGSSDDSASLVRALGGMLMTAERGRARQMNAGALRARGEVLWFLHADCTPGPGACSELAGRVRGGAVWGRFRTRLAGRRPAFRVIERFMHWRALVTGIATGDQGMFVRRDAFEAAGGFPGIPLMEDVALSRALRVRAWPAGCRTRLTTSSRRWERQGVLATVWLMWRLRFDYWRGADPAELARRYAAGGRAGDR